MPAPEDMTASAPEEIDIAALYARLRQEIRQTGAVDRGANGRHSARSAVRGFAERYWAVTAERPLERRRGVKGALSLPLKRLLRPLMRWYVEPLAYEQRMFNDAALKLIDALYEEIDRGDKADVGLNTRIDVQAQRLDEARYALSERLDREEVARKNSGTFRMSDTEIVAHIFSGIKIYLDPKVISVTPHLSLDHIWEETITNAWLRVIRPGDTIFDLGANFGYFGALAAQYAGTEAKVVFFEANPHLIPYIEKTLSINWLKQQSVVENLAVSDENGTATLNILKDYIGSSSLHSVGEIEAYMHDKMHVETEETVSVPTVTIDSYCRDHQIREVDLIKMDIEGYEEKAYAGMREVISASPNVTLFVEFTKDGYDNPQRFYEQMLNDFGRVYLIDERGKLVEPSRTDYKSVIGDSDDWVMPVFSKDGKLAERIAASR